MMYQQLHFVWYHTFKQIMHCHAACIQQHENTVKNQEMYVCLFHTQPTHAAYQDPLGDNTVEHVIQDHEE